MTKPEEKPRTLRSLSSYTSAMVSWGGLLVQAILILFICFQAYTRNAHTPQLFGLLGMFFGAVTGVSAITLLVINAVGFALRDHELQHRRLPHD